MQVICARQCGFRVDDQYFIRKADRFLPGICPRCSGPIRVVEDNSDTPIPGAKMICDPRASGRLGSIIIEKVSELLGSIVIE